MAYIDLDQRLVNALIADGRASHSDLAEALDVSVATVIDHLRELQEGNFLQEFVPVIDYSTFGYDITAITYLAVDGSALPEAVDWLADHDQLIGVYEVTGEFDVVLVGKYTDTDDVNRHLTRFLADPAIKESDTHVVLDAIREYGQFKLPVDGT